MSALASQHPQGTFSDTPGTSPHPRNGSDHSHLIQCHNPLPSSPRRTPLLLCYSANVSWLLTTRPAWEVQSDSALVRGQNSEKRTVQRVGGGEQVAPWGEVKEGSAAEAAPVSGLEGQVRVLQVTGSKDECGPFVAQRRLRCGRKGNTVWNLRSVRPQGTPTERDFWATWQL